MRPSTFFAISVIPGVRFLTNVTSSSILSTTSDTARYSNTPLHTFRILRTSASSNVRSNADVPERIPDITKNKGKVKSFNESQSGVILNISILSASAPGCGDEIHF